jgi:Virulence factor
VTEYQVTYWRDLPSLVAAREGEHVTKSPLAQRFQEAIDEAAMRLGATGSDAYLEGWRRTDWTAEQGSPVEVADRVVARLEDDWPVTKVEAYLGSLAAEEQA